jgi:hypothetical protein
MKTPFLRFTKMKPTQVFYLPLLLFVVFAACQPKQNADASADLTDSNLDMPTDGTEGTDSVSLAKAFKRDSIENIKFFEKLNMGKDFDVFYKKFHADSLYQISHINFPLQGALDGTDSLTAANNPNPWNAANWSMHSLPFIKGLYYEMKQPPGFTDIVMEKIVDPKTGFGILRRFKKNEEGEWFLIYYVGSNPMSI